MNYGDSFQVIVASRFLMSFDHHSSTYLTDSTPRASNPCYELPDILILMAYAAVTMVLALPLFDKAMRK
jgi:hypothetical protein